MTIRKLGLYSPLLFTGFVLMGVLFVHPRPSIGRGIFVGILLALAQSYISLGAMKWAWHKSFFYWIWGAGFFFRMLVLGGTAFVVYRYTNLSLVATLVSLVTATTLFLVIESASVFWKE